MGKTYCPVHLGGASGAVVSGGSFNSKIQMNLDSSTAMMCFPLDSALAPNITPKLVLAVGCLCHMPLRYPRVSK